MEFSINTRGEIAITRNQRIVTPLGTITLAAAAMTPVAGPPSETLGSHAVHRIVPPGEDLPRANLR